MTAPVTTASSSSRQPFLANPARVELLVIAVIALAVGVAEYASDGLRRATLSLVEREELLVVELIALLIVAAIGLAVYSWRRYREFVRAEQLNLRLQASVTEAEVRNQRYRSYADAVVRGQENERLRLARELHDDTIHRLILLGQKIELARLDLAFSADRSEDDRPDLDEVQQLTNATIDHIRRFIQDLRPTFLDELGLVPALRSLTDEKAARTGIDITLTTTGHQSRLGQNDELTLYRIAQTALRNVSLHSEATEAEILLDFGPDTITLTIEDDGVGFDVGNQADRPRDDHFGLLGMQERAELTGGRFAIRSTLGAGTIVRAEIPYQVEGVEEPEPVPQSRS